MWRVEADVVLLAGDGNTELVIVLLRVGAWEGGFFFFFVFGPAYEKR